MSYSMEIKNLSIALEALSRIQGLHHISREVERLLNKAITRMKEEDPDTPVHSRPPPALYPGLAQRAPHRAGPAKPASSIDDEIPF